MTAPAFPAPEQIAELCRLFRARQMQKPLWTHQAHLIVATDILYEMGAARGAALIRELIPLNNTHMGIPNSDTRGYHETITTLFINAIVPIIADPRCRDRDEGLRRIVCGGVRTGFP